MRCKFAVVRWGHECSKCNGIAGVELPEEVEEALALVGVGWIDYREVLDKRFVVFIEEGLSGHGSLKDCVAIVGGMEDRFASG